MNELFIFEGDGVLWDAGGSIFERKKPFEKIDRFTLKDSLGKKVSLDKDLFEVLNFLHRKGKKVSISRYYQEPDIIDILKLFGIRRYMSFIEVVWDKELGTYLKSLRDKDGNIEVVDQSKINFIEGRSAYLSLVGNTYFDRKMLDKAKVAYEEARELDSNNHAAFLGAAKVLYEQGDLNGSLELFRVAEERIVNPEVYFGIAKVFMSKSDSEAAKEYLKKTIDKDPNDPKAYKELYDLYLNEKDQRNAKRLMQQAVECVPKDKGASEFKKNLFNLCKVLPDG